MNRSLISICSLLLLMLISCNQLATNGGGSEGETFTTISGKITGPDGTGIPKARIRLRSTSYIQNKSTHHYSTGTFSDERGEFSLKAINGSYRLEASFDTLGWTDTIIIKNNRDSIRLENKQLQPVSLVQGQLSPGDTLSVYGLEKQVIADSLGEFKLPIPAGSLLIQLSTGNSVTDVQLEVPPQSLINWLPEKINIQCAGKYCINSLLQNLLQTLSLPVSSLENIAGFSPDGALSRLRLSGLSLLSLPLPAKWLLPELDSLDLSHNPQLNSLPGESSLYSNLKWIKLSHCDFQEVPVGLFGATQLHEIRMDVNHIYTIADSLDRWKELEILDLSYNNLYGLPASIGGLVSLREFYLTGNFVASFPAFPPALETLEVQGNNLCNLDETETQWLQGLSPNYENSQGCR